MIGHEEGMSPIALVGQNHYGAGVGGQQQEPHYRGDGSNAGIKGLHRVRTQIALDG